MLSSAAPADPGAEPAQPAARLRVGGVPVGHHGRDEAEQQARRDHGRLPGVHNPIQRSCEPAMGAATAAQSAMTAIGPTYAAASTPRRPRYHGWSRVIRSAKASEAPQAMQ